MNFIALFGKKAYNKIAVELLIKLKATAKNKQVVLKGASIMKKSLAALVMTLVAVSTIATATPQTEFHKGEFQIDLGAWNPTGNLADSHSYSHKWNFAGGLTYGLAEKLGLQYNFWEGKVKSDSAGYSDANGREHELNLLYSLNPKVAVYTGYTRLHPLGVTSNNVAQVGVVVKTPIVKNLDLYGRGALGTKNTSVWEAGVGYGFTKDFDLSVGYRHVNTKQYDEHSATYKGVVTMLSYRFGNQK